MAGKRAAVGKTAIVPSAQAASLDQYVPDLANWPKSWSVEDWDIPIGEGIVALLRPFLLDLLRQPLADKTRRRHRDHLSMLGGEIIRRMHDDSDQAKRSTEAMLLDSIEEDGGPLIWPRITESQQNAFDATCRHLHRFFIQHKSS